MSKLWIESDGTAAGTSVFVNEKELKGVKHLEITLETDGSSSVAIETDEVEVETDEVEVETYGCCCCEDVEPASEEVAPIELTGTLKEKLTQLIAARGPIPTGVETVSQEEAKEMLRKLLDPSLVNAATAVLVVDLRENGQKVATMVAEGVADLRAGRVTSQEDAKRRLASLVEGR